MATLAKLFVWNGLNRVETRHASFASRVCLLSGGVCMLYVCTGFVSYDNRDSAEKAISQMNGYQVRCRHVLECLQNVVIVCCALYVA